MKDQKAQDAEGASKSVALQKEVSLPEGEIADLRSFIADLRRRNVPPLTPRDVAGVALAEALRRVRIRHRPRNKRVFLADEALWYVPALQAVIAADCVLLQAVGFLPMDPAAGEAPWESSMVSWMSWMDEWNEIGRTPKRDGRRPPVDTREGCLWRSWNEIRGGELAPMDERLNTIALAARRVLRPPVDPMTKDELAEERENARANLFLILREYGPEVIRNLCYVDDDGHLSMGPTQCRDAIAKVSGVPRSGDKDPLAKSHLSLDDDSLADSSCSREVGTLRDSLRSGAEPEPVAIQAVSDALDALSTDLVSLIAESHRALDAGALLDALTRIEKTDEPARKAAFLRRALGGSVGRESLAEILNTTVSKIRSAEEKLEEESQNSGEALPSLEDGDT